MSKRTLTPKARFVQEAKAQNERKRRNMSQRRSFGGTDCELWCDGGERAFVSRQIRESVNAPPALWFTSLVSAEASLPK